MSRRTSRILGIAALVAGCGGGDGGPADGGASDDLVPAPDVAPDVSSDGDGTEPDVPSSETPERTVDLVDPFIATGGHGWNVGSGVPGATAPFGMVKASPDTTGPFGDFPAFHCGGYHAADDVVKGFSHTHLYGVGIPEYGNFLFMPSSGIAAGEVPDYFSPFDKATEEAHPGYYAVTLDATGIRAELTATTRAAHHRYTFPAGPEGPSPIVVVDLGHTVPDGVVHDGGLTVTAAGDLDGWVFQDNAFSERYGGLEIYFAARFDPPPSSFGTWGGEGLVEAGVDARGGPVLGAVLAFEGAERVEAQVAVSFVSVENARENLEAELPSWDFDGTRKAAEETWEERLSVVRFEGGTEAEREIMATALYHLYMMPTVFTDADGSYRGLDREVHEADGFTYYTDFSLWDTYRTWHPLITLVDPELSRDLMLSLERMMKEGGWLPKWPSGIGYTNVMVGTPADIVAADTYLKGVTGFDAEAVLDSMIEVATTPMPAGSPYEGRPGVADYLAHGFLPADLHGGSVAVTLEYAFADFAVARLAEALGRPDEAAAADERSKAYLHLWDPETEFLRGRRTDGAFSKMDPLTWEDEYVEGDAWQYLWFVPHDPAGLISLFASADDFVSKLETFFEEGKVEREALLAAQAAVEETGELDDPILLVPPSYYWHGNEPDLHAVYLFLDAGRPDLAQKWIRWLMGAMYGTGPSGLAGNDDAGTLSAWYVFSAMGLYPVPGTTRYYLGAPLFPRLEVAVAGGTLVVEAPDVSDANLYVQGVTFDGAAIDVPEIDHATLAAGGTLRFEMGPEPSTWGIASP